MQFLGRVPSDNRELIKILGGDRGAKLTAVQWYTSHSRADRDGLRDVADFEAQIRKCEAVAGVEMDG